MPDAGAAASQVTPFKAVHPVLFALVPTLSLYASNLTLLPAGMVWRPLLASVLLAVALWALARLVLKDWQRAAVFSSLSTIGFFFYARVVELLQANGAEWSGIAYCVVLVGVAAIASLKFRGTSLLNLFSLILVLSFGGRIAYGLLKETRLKQGQGVASRTSTTKLPDVYYIILDGHGREDVLRDLYGITQTSLARSLRERGFYVAEKSHSNYVQTELSLASSLNMAHLSDIIAGDPGENNRKPFDKAIEQNAVQRDFQQLGYQLVGVTTGFPAIRFPQAETGYEVRSGLSLLEAALLQSTPLAENKELGGSQYVARRKWLTNAFTAVAGLAGETAKPKMVVAHILAPHPPFVFGPNGEEVQYGKGFSYADGSDYISARTTQSDYRKGYAGQEQYIAQLTLKAVDAILAKSKTKPIIIIQGDHGPKSGLDQTELSKTDIDECFPILNAYYGPEDFLGKLYPEVTPVNSFRLVFSQLTGQEMKLLPDASYYSPFGDPMKLTDITKKLKK